MRSENNKTISFVYGAKSFRSHWNVGAVYIAPKITIAGNMENEKGMGSRTTSEYCKQIYEMVNEIQILKDVTVPRFDSRVSVILVRAKSRVAPLKLLSIPRLELMACCIGARLVNSILKALNMPDLKVTLWFDSTTALWWIKEYGNWSVFVANRVKEIRQLTQIQSWKRFIARRGRPRIIYCDNGTNFRGAFNDLAKLDWHKISRETSTQKIVWKFIPPTAAWWERLVRIIKELLRRSLGKSILSYEELSTVICECEFLINSRPLTYISENPQELIPLTPAMFLIDNRCSDTTDIDKLNSRDLRKRMKYRIKLLSDLRQRFRKEYLSELIQKQNDNRVREPRIGKMVLIGNDNKKRLSWPIAKIIELIPGRDGEIRTVLLKTQHGTVIRPVQRIFPLEVQAIANSDKELKEESISVESTTPEKVLNTNDAINKLGDTPLHSCAWKGHSEIVRMLLEKGADPTLRNSENKSAFDITNDSSCAALLKPYEMMSPSLAAEDYGDSDDSE
ncbi:integrase catalytic domain-containing protein [Trichonephila clavipes]|nr:integrase catalytic domain-containing protein [Trichonephila clavipes]